ncbi:LytR C-terminal domain-containing protein [Streptomyces sp. NPDC090108]|uniref:LytR C-terminal domain-containing protein n=1 Tax=Streptomyces sp. NPDC090108 TaxID=3365947 RepID=UPI00380652C4
MDTEGRGRGEDIDPSDQWVLNPRTGEYELRLHTAPAYRPEPAPAPPFTAEPAVPPAPVPRSAGRAARQAPATSQAPPASSAQPSAPASSGRRAARSGSGAPQAPSRRRGREPAPAAAPAGRRRSQGRGRRKAGRVAPLWTAGVLASLMAVGGTGGYLYLRSASAAPACEARPSGDAGTRLALTAGGEDTKGKAEEEARLKGSRSAPAEVRVDIYNAGAPDGSGQSVLTWLQNEKGVLKSSQLGSRGAPRPLTTLEYAPDQAAQARELAALMRLPGSALKPGTSEKNAQGLPAIVLTLGQDFVSPGSPLAAPKPPPARTPAPTDHRCTS